MSIITTTEVAQACLAELLGKQSIPNISTRTFITQPGTQYAETCIAYCKPGEKRIEGTAIALKDFITWASAVGEPFLEDAVMDYATDRMGGQLTIKVPNAKVPMVSEDSPITERINCYLQTEISPGLTNHGGQMSLVNVVKDNVAVLRFGGGCQGCRMVDITLKDSVEKTLIKRIPELKGVRGVTDHSNRESAYY